MNLVYDLSYEPLKFVIVNPIGKAAVMLCIKALRGVFFGSSQLIDLILLVYSNDVDRAEQLRWHLNGCGFPCNNSITITCDMPKLSDGDVFIFVTSFPDVDTLDFNNIHDENVFDSLYLLLKIANNLEMPTPTPPEEQNKNRVSLKKKVVEEPKHFKPVIITDGLLALDILKSFSKNLPDDLFFCPSTIAAIAKSALADHLKVELTKINKVYAYAANDDVFHVEVTEPIYLPDKTIERRRCEWDAFGEKDYDALKLDHTQFNAAWLKKDYVEKIRTLASQHPTGDLFTSARIAKALQTIWVTRSGKNPKDQHFSNMGIISDGNLGTIKGLPYYMPVVFKGDTFSINEVGQYDVHLKQEIKTINKTILYHHKKLMKVCKKFLEKHVINQEYLPSAESSTAFGTSSSSHS